MTILEARKLVPSEFKIACQLVKIIIKEEGEDFGEFDSLRNVITLNIAVYDDNKQLVYQTEKQFINTFYHELFHCFNFFFNTEMDEGLAQTFSNLMCEFLETRKDQ